MRRMLSHIPGARYAAGILGERLLGFGFAQRRRRLMAQYAATLGNRIRTGPFAGMQITDGPDAFGLMRLLGTYEPELHSVIEELLAGAAYDIVVNIGCAEGFYSVGLALRLLKAHVYAFDIDEKRQRLCLLNARQNRVDSRMTVAGRCTCRNLAWLLTPGKRALVFLDCEGAEKDLLQPDLAPGLLQADIVVECHDFLDKSITPTILERFSGSHEMTRIDERMHEWPDLPEIRGMSGIDKAVAMFEARTALMHWLILRKTPV
jgi:predicted O-methyltransferase YrrM